ncbi:MAG: putative cytosolic protein [Microgenomates group bacterium GW2011_GWA2_46_7]|nr:MAG: putative cytosolic protein [Microgenomates group bacterium GW2011_GWA2_46_7]
MHHFLNRLVNKAIEKAQAERVEKLKIKSTWNPDIVISRDPGSGGNPIAKKLAHKLGWQFFNKALMLKLSEELHIPTEELSHVDEHSRSWLADTFHSVFNPSYVSDVRYITHLKKILLHAAKLGDMVILGRGANLILPHDKCLRVRITASFETRVDNTYKFESVASKDEAAQRVRHIEKNRNQFIHQYFGTNPHNPWNYDLVISTDHLSLDQAVEIILQAYYVKFPKEGKSLKTKLS